MNTCNKKLVIAFGKRALHNSCIVSYADFLRTSRKNAGLSQGQLAQAITARGHHTTTSSISNIERRQYKRLDGLEMQPARRFVELAVEGSQRRPFAPSIDRIDCSKGYTINNVRLVCVAANVALGDWGDGVLFTLAKAMVAKYDNKCDAPTLTVTASFKPNAPKIKMLD